MLARKTNRIITYYAWLSCFAFFTANISSAESLNVLLIMADDVGYECFGSYGSSEYKTPHLDRLADSGIRFTHAHSTPLCTPTRVNLLSGKSNVFNYQDFGVYPSGEPTFANHFTEHGYRTAVAGKWQLQSSQRGRGISPLEAGFKTYCLWNIPGGGSDRYWDPSFIQDDKSVSITKDAFGPDVMTDFLIDFIREPSEKPFLAYYPMILVHNPFVPTPESSKGTRKDKFKRSEKRQKKNYVDMVQYMDRCVGRLIQAIDESGKRDQTLIIFTSDNGTNALLRSELGGKTIRGGKGYTHDYGTHVPLIVNQPGRIRPHQICDDLVGFSDFFPTLVEASGLPAKPIKNGDGQSFWPQCIGELRTGKKTNPREWIYGYYFPRPYARQLDNKYSHYPVRYARDKRFKLYDNGDLYDTLVDTMEIDPLPPSSDQRNPLQRAARQKLQQAIDRFPFSGQAINHEATSNLIKPGSHARSNP